MKASSLRKIRAIVALEKLDLARQADSRPDAVQTRNAGIAPAEAAVGSQRPLNE
jgi:hypothetical protein